MIAPMLPGLLGDAAGQLSEADGDAVDEALEQLAAFCWFARSQGREVPAIGAAPDLVGPSHNED